MAWDANYVFHKITSDLATLSGHITITNNTLCSYHNADLTLLRDSNTIYYDNAKNTKSFLFGISSKRKSHVKKSRIRKYHLKGDISSSTMIPNLSPRDIKFSTIYVIKFKKNKNEKFPEKPYIKNPEGINFNFRKVAPCYQFINSRDNNLGLVLPKGIVTIYDDGQMIGGKINHSEDEEEVLIKCPEVEVNVERKRTNFNVNQTDRTMSETIQYTVKNETDKDYVIEIRQVIYRTDDWKLISSNYTVDVRVLDDEIVLCVESGARSEGVFYCTINYTWDEEIEDENVTEQKKSFNFGALFSKTSS